MGNRDAGRARRNLDFILLALLGVLLFLAAFQRQRWDSDIFWALKSGEWIFKNLAVPITDPFSHTAYGSPWIDFTWGFQVIARFFYAGLGGWYGLFFLQLTVTALTVFFLYLNLRLLCGGGKSWMVVPLLYLAFTASHGRFFIRPHLFEYLFVSVYLYILNLWEKNPSSRSIFILLPLQVLWVNVHSSFILGIFIAGAYVLSRFVEDVRKNGFRSDISAGLKIIAMVAFLLPAVSLVNPYGFRLVEFPFVHFTGENADALRYIDEWTMPGFKDLLFYFNPFALDVFAFKLLLSAALVSFVLNRRGLKPGGVLLFSAALYMAIMHNRWVQLFPWFVAPVIAAQAAAYPEGRTTGGGGKALRVAAILSAAFFAAALLYGFSAKGRENLGVGLKKGVYPEGTVSFINREGVRGNIYNEYIFGGYLVYNDIRVFIDGRTPTVYSPYLFWTARVAEASGRWPRLVEDYGIDMALVKTRHDFCGKLREDKNWAPVMFDDVSVLYLKRGGRQDGIIEKWGLESLDPCDNESRYKLPEDTDGLKKMRDEAKRVAGYFSSGDMAGRVARPLRMLGLVDTGLGGEYLPMAVEELGRAVEINDDPYTRYDLGVALGKLKRYDEAVESFKKAASAGFGKGYLGMGVEYYDMKDYKGAADMLEKYVEMAGDMSEREALSALGFSCFELKRFDCAGRNLKRAAFVTDDPKELGRIYYHIGNADLETGAYTEAAFHYARAIEVEPQYAGVLKALAEDLKKGGKTEAAQSVSRAISCQVEKRGEKEKEGEKGQKMSPQ
ncbi:MAG: tetratricopeptide repeat protein [Deltaproteobacteria bacterium]|nr:tetratricopeptide repeat protein [Deltaproteobacteria bacterium]